MTEPIKWIQNTKSWFEVYVHPSIGIKALAYFVSGSTSQKALESIITGALYDKAQVQNTKIEHCSYFVNSTN